MLCIIYLGVEGVGWNASMNPGDAAKIYHQWSFSHYIHISLGRSEYSTSRRRLARVYTLYIWLESWHWWTWFHLQTLLFSDVGEKPTKTSSTNVPDRGQYQTHAFLEHLRCIQRLSSTSNLLMSHDPYRIGRFKRLDHPYKSTDNSWLLLWDFKKQYHPTTPQVLEWYIYNSALDHNTSIKSTWISTNIGLCYRYIFLPTQALRCWFV
jgi:hypothetical protein